MIESVQPHVEAQDALRPVLVVDDDEGIREVLCQLLEEEGYAALEAIDGDEALHRLRSSTSSLVVLLDNLMPRLNGPSVLREVAADPELAARHAFLFMSAARDVISLADELPQLARPITIVPKPFNLDDLLAAVAHARMLLRD